MKHAKLVLYLGLCLSACTSKSTQDLTGKKPFQFQPAQVTELSLTKADPDQQDFWNTTLRKSKDHWEISFVPNDKVISDRLVDETFIHHLIDVFQSIRVNSPAPKGPLESFGLNPPKFAIRWKTAERTFEFRMGQPAPKGLGTYFSIDGENVYIARSPAFQMLNMITSFEFLRSRSWTTLSADDIDEIHLLKSRKNLWYAQREGDLWTNAQHKNMNKNISQILNKMVQTRPLQIVDDEKKADEIRKEILSSTSHHSEVADEAHEADEAYEAKLTDRLGNISTLNLYLKKNTLYGMNSTRPGSVFILDQKLLKEL